MSQVQGMGDNWSKFQLLMWKNFLLQRRKWKQTTFDILIPLFFAILLVIFRSLINPELEKDRFYEPFCPLPKFDQMPIKRLCEKAPLHPLNGATDMK